MFFFYFSLAMGHLFCQVCACLLAFCIFMCCRVAKIWGEITNIDSNKSSQLVQVPFLSFTFPFKVILLAFYLRISRKWWQSKGYYYNQIGTTICSFDWHIHLTLTCFKGQGHVHFDCKCRKWWQMSKRNYCQQIWTTACLIDLHIYI